MGFQIKGNEKKYLATISGFLIVILIFIYYYIYVNYAWDIWREFIFALISNFVASLMTFFILYIYFGSRLEDNRETILKQNSTLVKEIEGKISSNYWNLLYEIRSLKNIQNIGAKLDNSADNYSKFIINIGKSEQDKSGILKYKEELEAHSKSSQAEISKFLEKIVKEKNPSEISKLNESVSELFLHNATIKNRLNTVEKIIESITISEKTNEFHKQIDAKNADIQQLNKKLKEAEQDKIQKDEKLKKLIEQEVVLKKHEEELRNSKSLAETNSKLKNQIDSQNAEIQQLNKKLKEAELDKIKKDEERRKLQPIVDAFEEVAQVVNKPDLKRK